MKRKIEASRRVRPRLVVLWRSYCLLSRAAIVCTSMTNIAAYISSRAGMTRWTRVLADVEQAADQWEQRLNGRARRALPLRVLHREGRVSTRAETRTCPVGAGEDA